MTTDATDRALAPDSPSARPSKATDDLDDLIDAFVMASRALIGVAVRSIEAAPFDVTVVQHRGLVRLETTGDLSIGALADQLGVNQSSVSRLCDRLERMQLTERIPSADDGRAVCVRIPRKGRRVVRTVHQLRRNEVRRILQRVPKARAREAANAMHAFAKAAGEHSEEGDYSLML